MSPPCPLQFSPRLLSFSPLPFSRPSPLPFPPLGGHRPALSPPGSYLRPPSFFLLFLYEQHSFLCRRSQHPPLFSLLPLGLAIPPSPPWRFFGFSLSEVSETPSPPSLFYTLLCPPFFFAPIHFLRRYNFPHPPSSLFTTQIPLRKEASPPSKARQPPPQYRPFGPKLSFDLHPVMVLYPFFRFFVCVVFFVFGFFLGGLVLFSPFL